MVCSSCPSPPVHADRLHSSWQSAHGGPDASPWPGPSSRCGRSNACATVHPTPRWCGPSSIDPGWRNEGCRNAPAFGNAEGRSPGRTAFLYQPVGVTGFEPATTCTPCKCATGLRYTPRKLSHISLRPSRHLGGMRYRAALHPEELVPHFAGLTATRRSEQQGCVKPVRAANVENDVIEREHPAREFYGTPLNGQQPAEHQTLVGPCIAHRLRPAISDQPEGTADGERDHHRIDHRGEDTCAVLPENGVHGLRD